MGYKQGPGYKQDEGAMSRADHYREALADQLRSIAAARREGVIEGLETAAKITSDPSRSNWSLNREIRAEIERRKRGEE